MFNESSGGGPWGGGGSGGSGGGKGGGGNGDDGLGPRSPWSEPPRKRPTGGGKSNFGPSALDELLRKGRQRFGGGGGHGPRNGWPNVEGKPIWLWGIGALLVLWVALTSVHRVDPQERAVITRFGKYAGLLSPGLGLTLPAPIDKVHTLNVEDIRVKDIGSAAGDSENLMLTGDQNLVDLAYSVRWNIRDPQLYLFELSDPDDTVTEVAESAMRAEVARVSLTDAIGPRRSEIEDRVARRMQEILDGYRAGIAIQGIAIKQADPPAAVVDAFKEVSAAQQTAQQYINQARAYAQQLSAKAKGEAGAFDRVYAEYKLAPEVTRRRMYYETMEEVLAKTDKTIIEAPGVTSYLPLPEIKRALPNAAGAGR